MTKSLCNESTPLNVLSAGGFQNAQVPRHLPKTCTSAFDILAAICVYSNGGWLIGSCFSAVAVLAGAAAAYHSWYALPAAACQQVAHEGHHDGETEFANWSATHKVRPQQLFEPETVEDLQRVVAQCHAAGDALQTNTAKAVKGTANDALPCTIS